MGPFLLGWRLFLFVKRDSLPAGHGQALVNVMEYCAGQASAVGPNRRDDRATISTCSNCLKLLNCLYLALFGLQLATKARYSRAFADA